MKLNMNITNMKLDTNIINILVGCLLGDAHISKSEKNKAFITFEQSIKHKDYILDIKDKLNNGSIITQDIKYYSRKDSIYNSINKSIYLKTQSYESLYFLANMFLSDANKKILPSNIYGFLNPMSLAYWISDDGQLVKKGGITLCTDNYTLVEVNKLKDILIEKYDLKCSIHYKKGKSDIIYNRLYIQKNLLILLNL